MKKYDVLEKGVPAFRSICHVHLILNVGDVLENDCAWRHFGLGQVSVGASLPLGGHVYLTEISKMPNAKNIRNQSYIF
jgi:hypothetical protein